MRWIFAEGAKKDFPCHRAGSSRDCSVPVVVSALSWSLALDTQLSLQCAGRSDPRQVKWRRLFCRRRGFDCIPKVNVSGAWEVTEGASAQDMPRHATQCNAAHM